MENDRRQQKGNTPARTVKPTASVPEIRDLLGTSIDRPRKPACLPSQMKLEIEMQQMIKRLARDSSNGALSDVGEYRIPKLGKHGCGDSSQAIYKQTKCI
jgi:hypothetical protein